MKKKEIEHYLNGKIQGIGSKYPYVRGDGIWKEVLGDKTLSKINYFNGVKHGLSEVFDDEANNRN